MKSSLTELKQVLSWFNGLDQATVPSVVWMHCQTALAEGFTNAVRHAHRDKSSETPIDIEVIIQDRALEIRIWDYGASFNLLQKLQMMAEVLSQDSTGGRGLLLMKRLCDELSYTRTDDDRNCLLIVKNFGVDSNSQS